MAKSKEELEKEIDRLLEQNNMSSPASIPYSNNPKRFYDYIKIGNKQEKDNQTRLEEYQAKANRLRNQPEHSGAYQKTVGQPPSRSHPCAPKIPGQWSSRRIAISRLWNKQPNS